MTDIIRNARRLVLDMDFGIDDSMALLYLLRTKRVEIVAIGTVHGNAEASSAVRNADQLLRTEGLVGIPLALGAGAPLRREAHFASEVHGADGIGGMSDGLAASGISTESAAQQLVRLAREQPGELTILATGPLTNLAVALELEPELPRLVHSVVIMGGSVHVPGNITSTAEANIWHDPEAAQSVLSTFENVTLVPLDITHQAWLDGEVLQGVREAPTSALGELVRGMLPQYIAFNESVNGRPGFPLHDPTSAVLVIDPDFASYEHTPLTVTVDDEDRGRITPGGDGNVVAVAVSPTRDIVAEFTSVAFS